MAASALAALQMTQCKVSKNDPLLVTYLLANLDTRDLVSVTIPADRNKWPENEAGQVSFCREFARALFESNNAAPRDEATWKERYARWKAAYGERWVMLRETTGSNKTYLVQMYSSAQAPWDVLAPDTLTAANWGAAWSSLRPRPVADLMLVDRVFSALDQVKAEQAKLRVWPYDNAALQKLLVEKKCAELQLFARVVRVRDRPDLVQRDLLQMKRSELAAVLIATMQAEFEATGSLRFAVTPDCRTARGGGLFARGPTEEQMLVCSLEQAGVARRAKLAALRRSRPCSGASQLTPEYGLRGGADCPAGYTQLSPNGCCERINEYAQVTTSADVAKALRVQTVLTPQEAAALQTAAAAGEEELTNAVTGGVRLESTRSAKFVFELLGSLQNNLLSTLGRQVDELLRERVDGGAQACEDEVEDVQTTASLASKLASGAQDTIATGLKSLWWLLRKVFGYTWTAMRVTIGKVGRTLFTVGEKMAYFIVTNPRQARVLFAVAKLFRNRVCRWLGEQLLDAKDFMKAAEKVAKNLQKKAGKQPTAVAFRAFSPDLVAGWRTFLDSGVSFVKDTVDATTLVNAAAQSNWFGRVGRGLATITASTLGSVPGVGGFLKGTLEVVGDIVTESVADSAKMTLEVLAYQNDFATTFGLLFDLVNLNECLVHMPQVQFRFPGIYWLATQLTLLTRMAPVSSVTSAQDDQQFYEAEKRELKAKERAKKLPSLAVVVGS